MIPSTSDPLAITQIPGPETHQATTYNAATKDKVVVIARGQRATVATADGCGYIAKLWLTFPGYFWQHWAANSPVSQTILKTLILRIYFDGEDRPAVEAPVGDFFGNGLCEISNFASRYLGESSGGFYCSFPMPFRSGFRVELENLDDAIDTYIFCNVLYQLVPELPAGTGTFHAHFRTGENAGPEVMEIANVSGAGRYVGCTLAMQGAERNYLSFLEAPEFVHIDDDWDSPRIIGTGLEDYFLGGWYFREGEFIGPTHGVTSKDVFNASVAMYRTHDLDAIHFKRRLKFTFITPWAPDRLKPFRYSSVAFLYLNTPQGCGEPLPGREKLLCWYRVKNTDHLSVP